jgi:FkbM family methyltransferase
MGLPIPTIKDTRHGKLMYYSTDDYVGRSLDLYGEYSEIEWNVYSQIVKEGMLIIDGGANIGAFTIPFGKAVGSTGIVYAFEPQIEIYNMLTGNIALNCLSRNVKPINGALGATTGVIDVASIDYSVVGNFGGLSVGRDPPMMTDESAANKDKLNYYQVSMYTIDGLQLDGLSLLKLDIEGAELAALIGGVNTIQKYRPAIYVENNDEQKSAELIDFLWRLDYNCWWDVSPLHNPDNFFKNPNKFENYSNINMLCFHKDRHITINDGAKVQDRNEWKARFPLRVSNVWKKDGAHEQWLTPPKLQ